MGTVIQDMPQINPSHQPRWDRFERAELFEQYRELRNEGLSERQAAKELKVPRSCPPQLLRYAPLEHLSNATFSPL